MRNTQKIRLQYGGITSSPDDYLSPDGELAACIGLESANGAKLSSMRHAPKEISRLELYYEVDGAKATVLFVHEMELRKVAMVKYENPDDFEGYRKKYYNFVDVTNGWPAVMTPDNKALLENKEVIGVKNVGNTLIVQLSDGLGYWLWNSESNSGAGGYDYLGDHIPELELTFGLQEEYCHYLDGSVVENDNSEDADVIINDEGTTLSYFDCGGYDRETVEEGKKYRFKEKDRNKIYSYISSPINKLHYEIQDKGYFAQPFLVRYALKLYDGSTTMASSPVYMPVVIRKDRMGSPFVVLRIGNGNEGGCFFMNYIKAKLDYAVAGTSLSNLKKWSDIVKSVVVSVTDPIYTYNPSVAPIYTFGKPKSYGDPTCTYASEIEFDINFVGRPSLIGEKLTTNYRCQSILQTVYREDYVLTSKFYPAQWDNLKSTPNNLCIPTDLCELGYKSESELDEEIKNKSIFYVFKTIDLDDLKTTRTILHPKKGLLNTLVNQPTLDDEYHSHDGLSAGYMKVYNGRLNLADIKRTLYNNFFASTMLPYVDIGAGTGNYVQFTFTIDEGGEKHVVKSKPAYGTWAYPGLYVYYPNTNAKKVVVVHKNGSSYYYKTISMEEHPGLNGSIAMDKTYNADMSVRTVDPSPAVSGGKVSEKSKLYTSNALNPFVFQPKNINTIGNGKVLAMAVANKSINLTDAGLYPMYCMTEDGVWILEVSQTGGWSSKKAIMTDVVTVPEAIVEVDNAVLIPTSRGIMMLQGEDAVCITDTNNKVSQLRVSDLPYLNQVLTLFKTDLYKGDTYDFDTNVTVDVSEYIDSPLLRGLFDYKNQRVIYFRADRPVSIVYDLAEKQMTCQMWNIQSSVNGTVDCLATVRDELSHTVAKNYLCDISGISHTVTGTDSLPMGLKRLSIIISRPIKGTDIGARDERKKLDCLWHQGRFAKTGLNLLVYGTTDYKTWMLMEQAKDCSGLFGHHGQHWLAFVVVMVSNKLTDKDYLSSYELDVTTAVSNKANTGYKI